MCCEDQRIQAGVLGSSTTLALTTNSQKAASQNNKRRTLVLNSAISGTTTYSPGGIVVSGVGINLTAGARPVIFTFREHGEIVTKEFTVIHSAGSVSTIVIEGVEVDGPC